MNVIVKKILLYSCSCLILISAAGQAPKLNFRHIGIEQGLSNSTVENIFQDKKGFMWIGTRDGLNRYDGYKMITYRFSTKDSTSISDNQILFIYEDHNQFLWVGTPNGLNRYDPAKNTFTRFKHSADNPNSISNNVVNCIYEDVKGNLWIGTFGGGINLLKSGENIFRHFRHRDDIPRSLGDDRVNYFYEDKEGNFWVANETGLDLFNRETGSFKPYQPIINGDTSKTINKIRIIQQAARGILLLGTANNGLLVFNEKENSFKQYLHSDKNPASLGSNLIRSLLVNKKGDCWIGSVNGGLDFFNIATGSFYNYQNEPENISSLSQRTVSALFEDNQGNFWVGTHRGGLNLYLPDEDKFALYRPKANENSLSYKDVTAFEEDREGNIWIGTDGGGLNLFNRKTATFKQFKNNSGNPKTLGKNEVLNVMQDSEGNIWVGTWGGGLNLYDKKDGSFTRFVNDPSDTKTISSNYVQKIFEDHEKNLWVGTYYGGLNLFNRKTKQFSRVVASPENKSYLSGINIVSIIEDKKNNLWIGTDDGGLNCMDAVTKTFSHYFNKEEKLPDLRILFVDSKGRLWAGQKGLYLFKPQARSFALYTDKAGLSDEFIKGITEDDLGNFWIATSNGITRFNPESFSFKKYNTIDGLQGLEFEANAFLKTKDGQMFFGGENGMNTFHPDNIKTNSFIPPVYITEFQLFNKKIFPGNGSPIINDISVTNKIELTHKQSTFSFEFAALNYTGIENNQYSYKLEGWDKDWILAGKERKASYTNLSVGNYTFRVKASNNDGVWNEQGSFITIEITPPFWATWWFRLLCLIIVAAAAFKFYQFRRRLESRQLEVRKKEEIHQVQLQFFTNISHEFRTPLSLILGPVEKLQKEDSGTANNHYYKVIHRNASRLMDLVNELMDFRKSETGILKLHVMPGNISPFLKEIYEEFAEMAIEKNINFTVDIPEKNKEIWYDRQVLEKIAINLIGNSFKYTKAKGSIKVEVLESMENFKPSFENEFLIKNEKKGNSYIYLRVADNGIGISKESIAHLFERYFKITDTHLGSGIGLAFVKSLTILHKGEIFVYSESKKGTEIIIGIPVGKEDYEPEERWVQNHKETGARLESIHSKYEYGLPEIGSVNPVSEELIKNPLRNHILIVDDNEELRTFLKESLSEQYHITEACDGKMGIAMAKETFPDLIISDVMMPEMDGIEFCKLIKEDIETSHIPFLMLTARDAVASRIAGIESGADFYFSKPLSMELLSLTIRNIFIQKQKLTKRYLKDEHAQAKDLVHSKKDKAFMEELITLIEAHLDNPEMDVDYICTQIGMSRTKLYQKIKTITGQSIGEFVRIIRLKKAVQLMTHQDISLSEVMYGVGIQTQSYFTKAFKKEFGKTPSQFLKDLNK